ncbi:putative zinc-type alcohol dehydrogenase-like protein [Arcticibacter tournemirensis]|uniref:NAD(P)-dependent alcohol dehydrogenase n=1 Tax=Arcticibacter tournemirensis TaxID=699437 RepID=A0A5M9H4Y5_9SPHI|nr:NAD(P)-dependent alcohol dehydrogenase [Arcticibacter tournemirensis]KAA8480198.1 NAD(P)-dependent alcohol dehydrogenase [Arcticibacter tournemirensis]TQM52680.1 putative zinc-type alcohol dehydrogenase-like protein [Arcticibacter tournemirensis]
MTLVKAYAAHKADKPLEPFQLERREPGSDDVEIKILYCGVCHSDIHTVRNEWGGTMYPVVPGHEIVGRVTRTGNGVSKFKEGDLVGVGCFVDSCRECNNCREGNEQYCENGHSQTYNSLLQDKKTITYGGYSSHIVVTQDFVLRVPESLPAEKVAPLLCAGITTYSPLRHWGVKKGDKVAVVGLGGLGHMAVKLAASMGAEVTMLSRSPGKEKDAQELGAHHFALTINQQTVAGLANTFDFIIDTVSAEHDYNSYLAMLRTNGVMVLLGVPPKPSDVHAVSLILGRRSLVGSLVGGIKETQEMLDYCAEHNITSDVEVIPMSRINEAYERTISGDVHYRFVIDMSTLD